MDKRKSWKRQISLFLVSQNLSIFGSSVVDYAIIWYITLKTSSGVWITISTIATLLPQVVISLWAGVIADRCYRKWIIMISDGFTAFATLLAFFAFHLGMESLPLLIAVSFLRSLSGGFQSPAVSALYPEIVPEDQLVRINGINQTLTNILLLISPAVGGMILGTIGIQWSFLIDVSTAALAILIMSQMKLERKTKEGAVGKDARSSVFAELREGIRYASNHQVLKTILICHAVTFILVTPTSFLSPLMITRTFGGEVWKLTANEIFWTAGSLAGGVFVAWKGKFKNRAAAITASLIGFGSTFALMGFSRYLWQYLILDCISGMFVPIFMTALTVLIQTSSDAAYMGRVFSLQQFVSRGVMPVSILVFGPLGDRVQIQTIIIVCGALLILWSFWFYRAARRWDRA